MFFFFSLARKLKFLVEQAELVPELEVAKLHPSIEIVANLYDGGVRPPGTDAPNKPNEQCEENYQIGKVQVCFLFVTEIMNPFFFFEM